MFAKLSLCAGWLLAVILRLAAGLVVATVLFAGWRLQQGPVPLAPLIDHLPADATGAAALAFARDGWLHWRDPLRKDPLIRIGAVDGPGIGLHLDGGALWRGEVRPTAVAMMAPSLRITRARDGAVQARLALGSLQTDLPLLARADDSLVMPSLASVSAALGVPSLPGLVIEGARLRVVDAGAGLALQASGITAELAQEGEHLTLRGAWSLHLGARPLAMRGTLVLGPQGARARLHLADVAVADLVHLHPAIAGAAGSDVRLTGQLDLALGPNLAVQALSADLRLSPGTLRLSHPKPTHFRQEGTHLRLTWDPQTGAISLSPLTLQVGQRRLALSGAVTPQGAGMQVRLAGSLAEISYQEIMDAWPPGVAVKLRRWAATRLAGGRLANLDFNTVLVLGPDGAALEDLRLAGAIDGVSVTFLPPMKPVQDGSGRFILTRERLAIDFTGGHVDEARVTGGSVDLTGFTAPVPHLALTLEAEGPVATLVAILDQPPIALDSKIAIDLGGATGHARGTAHFDIPIKPGLQLPDIDYRAQVALSDVRLPSLVGGEALDDGDLTVSVTPREAEVTGTGSVQGHRLRLRWRRPMLADAQADTVLSAYVPAQMLAELGLRRYVRGPIAATLWLQGRDLSTPARLDLDASQAEIRLPTLAAAKPAGERLTATAQVQQPSPDRLLLTDIRIEGPSLRLTGEAEIAGLQAPAGPTADITLTELRTGRGDQLRGRFRYGPGEGIRAEISGERVSLAPILAARRRAAPQGSDVDLSGFDAPFDARVNLALATIDVDEDIQLRDVTLHYASNQREARTEARLQGLVSGTAPMALSYNRRGMDRHLTGHSQDAGHFLAALAVSPHVRGGTLDLTARQLPHSDGAPHLRGQIVLSDVRVVEAPTLARLLSALSLDGLLGFMDRGEGLRFSRFAVDFDLSPDQVVLRNGRTAGNALGLAIEGTYDRRRDRLNLHGTAVPASSVNKIIGEVPLLGTLLTGVDGGGLFAGQYTITGSIKDPDVELNPLTALAPGIVRNIFFIDSDPLGSGRAVLVPEAAYDRNDR